ncbi:MAG TPA: CoA-binding protein, partial [Rhodothermales bacterium]
ATYMGYMGYEIIPVNPFYPEVLGRKAYPSLRDLPMEVDLVDVFRPSSECLPIAEDAVAIGAKAVWLQLRVVNVEAAELARDAGLAVVMDRCVKMEHGRYNGSMHWVGMNTGIISARRDRRWF